MRKLVKILLLALMLALLPLRSIAAAIGFVCPAEEITASHLQAPVDENLPCNLCVAHCAGGAFVASSALVPILAESAESNIAHAERNATAVIPDQLDRPPLA
jgi:hypothetical protein